MKVTDIVKGKITLEAHDIGVTGECNVVASGLGKAILFDSFCRTMHMYNRQDSTAMMAIIGAGGLDKLVGSKIVAIDEKERTQVDRIERAVNETEI